MITFLVLAAVCTVAVVLAVLRPLLRRNGAGAPALVAAAASAGVLILGGAILYALWSNWSWRAVPAANAPQTMVAQLARRLESNPQDLDGWLLLGRSYIVLQEFPLAVRAYQRADRLSGGKNPEALLGEAEGLALQDPSELEGRAGRLIERSLELDPNSGKALFFGATVAARRGNLPLARERFAKLLAMNPPETVRPLIEQQIRALDERLAAAPVSPAGTGADAAVRVNITLAPSLSAGAGQGPLFVFVRRPGGGGPPLAVKRLESHFPQAVTLTAADSPMGGAFGSGQSVQVVARIARSGAPTAASGDPYGEVTYRVGQDGLISLVIDRITP